MSEIAVGTRRCAPARTTEPMVSRRAVEPTTILVVDDSPIIRLLIADMLLAAGYNVDLAEDGLEALLKIRTRRPDAVLTDLNMPRMDGFSLIEAVRRTPELSDLPILVVTSEESRIKRALGLAAGANGWIVKPFEPAELIEALWGLDALA